MHFSSVAVAHKLSLGSEAILVILQIIFTNVGNPHALGQKPLTFPRQVHLDRSYITFIFGSILSQYGYLSMSTKIVNDSFRWLLCVKLHFYWMIPMLDLYFRLIQLQEQNITFH